MSMMTIVTRGDDKIIEQIVKQLNKVIDVIKVVDLNESEFVERETALIKIHTRQEDRAEALRIADIFRGKVVDSTRSEEHTSELQSQSNLVCRLLLEKKKKKQNNARQPTKTTTRADLRAIT